MVCSHDSNEDSYDLWLHENLSCDELISVFLWLYSGHYWNNQTAYVYQPFLLNSSKCRSHALLDLQIYSTRCELNS